MTAARVIEPVSETIPTYVDYLKGAIIETVSDLADENTLKYIHTVLMQAVTAGTQLEGC